VTNARSHARRAARDESHLRGLSSAEIAAKLGRSPQTIRAQTTALYRKLGVGSPVIRRDAI